MLGHPLSLQSQVGNGSCFTLRVPRGSFYGFLGENGAGKSTTISMLTGVLAPTAGEMRVLGRPVAGDAVEVKRRIGVVPDGMLLFDRLTGREHLTFVGRLFGLGRQESARRADELLEATELSQDARKLVADYSFGMKKKLGLAAALIHGPELLFLDEPFEGVDAVAKTSLTALLAGLVERGRLTVFLTSHVLEIVEKLCTHVGIIVRGDLVEQAALETLRQGRSLEDRFLEMAGADEAEAPKLRWLEEGTP